MSVRQEMGRLENPFRTVSGASPGTATGSREDLGGRAADGLDLRAMTGFEEELVERYQSGVNTAALCNEVLARCHVGLGRPVDEARERVRGLLVAERDAALIELRRMSIGDVVESLVTCTRCGHDNAVEFRLSDLPIDLPPAPTVVDTELPDGTAVRMRLPTAGDQEDVVATGLGTAAERRSWLLARVVLSFGDDAGPFDTEFGQRLTVGQRRQLEAALDHALPDLDLSMTVTCDACEAEFAAPFDVADFFLPR